MALFRLNGKRCRIIQWLILQLIFGCITKKSLILQQNVFMSRHEKLIEKLLRLPKNFTYDEMVALLRGFGYMEEERRRSSGSAVIFYNEELNDKIMFHKPHPQKELKRYIPEMIIEKLKINEML